MTQGVLPAFRSLWCCQAQSLSQRTLMAEHVIRRVRVRRKYRLTAAVGLNDAGRVALNRGIRLLRPSVVHSRIGCGWHSNQQGVALIRHANAIQSSTAALNCNHLPISIEMGCRILMQSASNKPKCHETSEPRPPMPRPGTAIALALALCNRNTPYDGDPYCHLQANTYDSAPMPIGAAHHISHNEKRPCSACCMLPRGCCRPPRN